MAAIIQAIIACLTGSDPDQIKLANEKPVLLTSDVRKAEDIASNVVQALVRAEKGGKELQKTLG